jgi:hypothetical protein
MGRVTPVTESVPCGTILTQINMAAEVRQYAQCMRTPAKILKHDEGIRVSRKCVSKN